MKKLLYIDNDDERMSEQQIKQTQRFLSRNGLSDEYIESMQFKFDLWRMDRDQMSKLFFDGDSAIVTWSVYCRNGVYDSKQQLISLMAGAGRYNIQDKIYIDATGMMIEQLENKIREDEKLVWCLLNAVNQNFIISHVNQKTVRLFVDIKGRDESPFRFEPIDLNTLLAD